MSFRATQQQWHQLAQQSPLLQASITFCPHCSNLLQQPDLQQVQHCFVCSYKQYYDPLHHSVEKVSRSSRFAEKDKARAKHVQQSLEHGTKSKEQLEAEIADEDATGTIQTETDENIVAAAKRATVSETCEKCGHPELSFHTMQMRSVDEGQTVFYECTNCGHNYSTNT